MVKNRGEAPAETGGHRESGLGWMMFREKQETCLGVLRQGASQVNRVAQGVLTTCYSTKTQEEMPLTQQRDGAVESLAGRCRQAQTIKTTSDGPANHSRFLGYKHPYMQGWNPTTRWEEMPHVSQTRH